MRFGRSARCRLRYPAATSGHLSGKSRRCKHFKRQHIKNSGTCEGSAQGVQSTLNCHSWMSTFSTRNAEIWRAGPSIFLVGGNGNSRPNFQRSTDERTAGGIRDRRRDGTSTSRCARNVDRRWMRATWTRGLCTEGPCGAGRRRAPLSPCSIVTNGSSATGLPSSASFHCEAAMAV
jgi:hypothetical protein